MRILFAKWFSHFAEWFEHHQENQVFTKWIFTMWTSLAIMLQQTVGYDVIGHPDIENEISRIDLPGTEIHSTLTWYW